MSANDDAWIAGHEAAHAAAAIEMGCPIRAVCLKPLAGSTAKSNARTVWRPGKAQLADAAAVAAAGPSYDAGVAAQFKIPPGELAGTAKYDKHTSDELADSVLQKRNSQQFVDYLWNEAKKRATAVLARSHVQAATQILTALIQARRAAGEDLITSKDVYDAVRHLYPAEKLDLTDPNEDVRGDCQKW